ncbi:MAG: hypothetical protein WCT49_04630 [Candidatus Paceibacterota bacterium]|jgi:hypothetical protein|nr:hypothetical protein [Candidatus Paceibacterota bacterium]
MKTKTFSIGTLALVSVLFCGSVSIAFAEAPISKNVTFTVTIGKLECKDGVAQSIVKFENSPMEGGYYEITGEMITKNNISLSREVPLPTGTYFWNGIPQTGYSTTSPSSGTVIIKECPKTAPSMQTLEGGKDEPIISQPVVSTSSEIADLTKSLATGSEEKASTSQNFLSGEMQKKALAVLLIGAVVAGYLYNKYGARLNAKS